MSRQALPRVFRWHSRCSALVGGIGLLWSLLAVPVAMAQTPSPGTSSGSSSDGRHVFTYRSEDEGTSSYSGDGSTSESGSNSGGGSGCSNAGGSEITVTTEKGTTHSSSGGGYVCRSRSSPPAAAGAQPTNTGEAGSTPTSRTAATSPLPELIPTSTFSEAQASPEITIERTDATRIAGNVGGTRRAGHGVYIWMAVLVILGATGAVVVRRRPRAGKPPVPFPPRPAPYAPSRAPVPVRSTVRPSPPTAPVALLDAPVKPPAMNGLRVTSARVDGATAYLITGWVPVPRSAPIIESVSRTVDLSIPPSTVAASLTYNEADILGMWAPGEPVAV